MRTHQNIHCDTTPPKTDLAEHSNFTSSRFSGDGGSVSFFIDRDPEALGVWIGELEDLIDDLRAVKRGLELNQEEAV